MHRKEGFQTASALRAGNSRAPIILLTLTRVRSDEHALGVDFSVGIAKTDQAALPQHINTLLLIR